MIGSHPLLQVYRIIKELRVALPLSHHDGNTLLAHLPQLGYFFLSSQADLGNTPLRFDPNGFPFLRTGKFNLCQQFIWYNPAKLPTPAQWVTIERIRLKDASTHLWWMSPSERPKADNRCVLVSYSDSMRQLLRTKKYNSGWRPWQHYIGEKSFLKDNKGAIPSNVLTSKDDESQANGALGSVITLSNTHSSTDYQRYCRQRDIEPHPARMPLPLAEFFIKLLTEPRDLVLDPFGGSDTTARAAENLNRR
jgi:site-specific DNA-methyltransferase (cytosine-N4-specific)